MRAYVETDQFSRTFTVYEFMNTGRNPALYRVIGTNRHIALMDRHGYPLNGIHELAINEDHEVPLYKQAMDMQIGRVPKTVTKSRKTLRLQQITAEEGSNCRYKLYIALFY